MSVSVFVAFERETQGKSIGDDTSVLADSWEELDKLAKELKVTTFSKLNGGQCERFLFDIMGEEMGIIESDLPKKKYFQPTVGLKTVRAVLEFIRKHPKRFKKARAIVQDLKTLEKDLLWAQRHRVPFLLAMAD